MWTLACICRYMCTDVLLIKKYLRNGNFLKRTHKHVIHILFFTVYHFAAKLLLWHKTGSFCFSFTTFISTDRMLCSSPAAARFTACWQDNRWALTLVRLRNVHRARDVTLPAGWWWEDADRRVKTFFPYISPSFSAVFTRQTQGSGHTASFAKPDIFFPPIFLCKWILLCVLTSPSLNPNITGSPRRQTPLTVIVPRVWSLAHAEIKTSKMPLGRCHLTPWRLEMLKRSWRPFHSRFIQW